MHTEADLAVLLAVSGRFLNNARAPATVTNTKKGTPNLLASPGLPLEANHKSIDLSRRYIDKMAVVMGSGAMEAAGIR